MNNIVLSMKNVSKSYNNVKVLNNINIQVEKGKIYCLRGENGAGKSTLIRIILGLSFCNSGSIEIFGLENKLENSRKFIGSLIESPILYPYLSAKENLKLAQMEYGSYDEEYIDKLLKIMNLNIDLHKKVCDFSLGMKQKLGILLSIINKPKILILDEPLNALDHKSILIFKNLLLELVKKEEMSIIISGHLLNDLDEIIDYYFCIENMNIKTFPNLNLETN